MNYLPYGDTTKLGWMSALGTSAVLHGGGALALFAIGSTSLTIAAGATQPPAAFEVTIEDLDADTLAGLIEQAGVAGSDGDETAAEPTETAPTERDGDEPSIAAPPMTEPDIENSIELPLERPEVVAPDIAEPDPIEGLGTIEPETIEPISETPVTVSPVDEHVIAAAPVVDEDVSINPIMNDNQPNPVMPEEMTPVSVATMMSDVETVTATTLTQTSDTVEAITPLGTSETLGTADASLQVETVTSNLSTPTEPTTPIRATPPPAPPTAQDLAVRDLINRIRTAPSPSCGIALPRRDGVDGVGLALLSAQEGTMEALAQSVLTADDANIRQTRTLVDSRQCPALEFVVQSNLYPAMQIGIQTEQTSVTSGDTLTGAIRGIGGRFLTLIMVDDNGVVTDLQRFTATAGALTRFDVPVTRVGLARETRPLIIALATERPPTALRARMGQLAADVFRNDVTGDLGEVRLGLVAVDVR